MINRFPGKCAGCGARVEAGAGEARRNGGGRERPVLPREAWVCRTAGWRDGILARVGKVQVALGAVPACPDCGAPTRKWQSQHGAFWGCAAFPECRGIARSEEARP